MCTLTFNSHSQNDKLHTLNNVLLPCVDARSSLKMHTVHTGNSKHVITRAHTHTCGSSLVALASPPPFKVAAYSRISCVCVLWKMYTIKPFKLLIKAR